MGQCALPARVSLPCGSPAIVRPRVRLTQPMTDVEHPSPQASSPQAAAAFTDDHTAAAELEAAARLIADADLDPALGAEHIRRAAIILAREAGHPDPAAWTAQQCDHALERDEFAAGKRALDWVFGTQGVRATSVLPTRSDFLFLIRALAAATRDVEAPRKDEAYRIGLMLIFGVLILMIAAPIYGFIRGPIGPWKGRYYDGKKFKGEPEVEHALHIDFDWKREPPMRKLGPDRWSVIWDTCWIVDEPQEVRFRIRSDDGSRLYLDGEKVLENWGNHAARTRTGRATVQDGLHHLRIEYYEASKEAMIKLEVAYGKDGEWQPLSPANLKRPSSDEDDPCGLAG